MSYQRIAEIVRSPTGGLTIALFASFVVASLASAGLNTLGVARVLLIASLAIATIYVFCSDTGRKLTKRQRALTMCVIVVLLLGTERVETWAQPKPAALPSFPVPPLLLVLKDDVIRRQEDTPLQRVPGQSFAVSYISRPQGGYAGFGDNGTDDPMLGIPDVDFVNLTGEPLSLAWDLRIEGEGRSFTLTADGHGRWERQLNESDFIAKTRREIGGDLGWRLSPLALRPHQRLAFQDLAFVAPNADADLKQVIVGNKVDDNYKITMIFVDLRNGRSSEISLPFGRPPTKTYSSYTQMLKDVAREQGYELNTSTGKARKLP